MTPEDPSDENMPDDDFELADVCADLVSLRDFESFVWHLLQMERARWRPVAEVLFDAGLACPALERLGAELFVTWLEDPGSAEDYTVIVFYDRDSKWSMTAEYNRQRLCHLRA